jgi:hypothetical protein
VCTGFCNFLSTNLLLGFREMSQIGVHGQLQLESG